MRSFILFMALSVLLGCGAPYTTKGISLGTSKILRQGYIQDQSAVLQWQLKDVEACLAQEYPGPLKEGSPLFIYTDGPVLCGDDEKTGCTDFDNGIIYLMDIPDMETNYIFAHELVHYKTEKGDEFHDRPYFSLCESPALRGTWGAGYLTNSEWRK